MKESEGVEGGGRGGGGLEKTRAPSHPPTPPLQSATGVSLQGGGGGFTVGAAGLARARGDGGVEPARLELVRDLRVDGVVLPAAVAAAAAAAGSAPARR